MHSKEISRNNFLYLEDSDICKCFRVGAQLANGRFFKSFGDENSNIKDYKNAKKITVYMLRI